MKDSRECFDLVARRSWSLNHFRPSEPLPGMVQMRYQAVMRKITEHCIQWAEEINVPADRQ